MAGTIWRILRSLYEGSVIFISKFRVLTKGETLQVKLFVFLLCYLDLNRLKPNHDHRDCFNKMQENNKANALQEQRGILNMGFDSVPITLNICTITNVEVIPSPMEVIGPQKRYGVSRLVVHWRNPLLTSKK